MILDFKEISIYNRYNRELQIKLRFFSRWKNNLYKQIEAKKEIVQIRINKRISLLIIQTSL